MSVGQKQIFLIAKVAPTDEPNSDLNEAGAPKHF